MICFKCGKSVDPFKAISGLHQKCFSDWFNVDNPQPFQDVVARESGSSSHEVQSEWMNITSSFYLGKFKKYSARLFEKSYILKVQEKDYAELPATEFLCNQIAKHLELDVPNFYFILLENKVPTFVCENFMQYHISANLVHIYRFLNNTQEYNCEGLYHIILEKTQQQLDAIRFVHLTLFDALIGNHDRHGRNIGLIHTSQGYRLSPCYDNPSYLGLEIESLLGAQHEPRGRISTQNTTDPTIKDYVIEWERLNLSEVVQDFFSKIEIDKIIKLIEKSYISNERKQALIKLISKRYEEFRDVISG